MIIVLGYRASAQQTFTLSGTVTDDKGVTLPSATVFLSGTTRVSPTDLQGKFSFPQMSPGTYQLSASMVGFEPYSKSVVIRDSSVTANIILKIKTTDLKEVVINPAERARNYALFRNAFLGMTENAKSCTILNPEVVSFKFDKKERMLTADADDFLMIENKRLGYRIKYLIKDFNFDLKSGIALYDGETNFEELPGKASDKKKWLKNRSETYHGSMMHFLRSVYKQNPLKDGFIAYNIFQGIDPQTKAEVLQADPYPADFSRLVMPNDTSFVTLRFKNFYLMYDPSKAAKITKDPEIDRDKILKIDDKGTVMRLIAKEAVIDRRGSHADYKTFYIQGAMADKRVGDQLPFEYQP
ncbi:carboxypeptidase-like regulatory domain-containing protein [Mucilaginibacter myungsuensis]|uniref:Carboxypeptidase-like regulatory domain-containing protein n=1 Tax=Mucilaginibacter myungsuensis TaxID=649104 RepID=A0A929PYG8_9SPHI|nr:carboxypeptidase-like regulatory domain-containing protein [Mucilaginibacter myungsuensis]MBE9663322.1 carboxypeptidase-like regulatory domain-containing protein [Mucilaginibacter myungsuensis]MDN3600057.1 carboxypeptidase-like regulatory domain-containing protein [Mucilaginibacter myungsuensis]